MRKKSSAKAKNEIKSGPGARGCDLDENLSVVVHPELKLYFAYCFIKAAAYLRAKVNRGLESYQIIAPQLGIMRLLSNQKMINQKELGHVLGIDKATMVKFIDELEKHKYVVRKGCEVDRRIKYLSLTPFGEKKLQEISRLRVSIEEEFFSPLTAQERAVVKKAIPKLLRWD